MCCSRRIPPSVASLVCAAGVFMAAANAHAQYRNNGLYAEVSGQTFEVVPYTAATVLSSQLAHAAWRGPPGQALGLPAPPGWATPCGQRLLAGRSPGCQHDWFGLGDGMAIGVGYQRVIGDLLLDVSESPLLQNIVLVTRLGLVAAPRLWTWAWPTPVLGVQQEVGLRWNILDEEFRPYVAAHAGMMQLFDPVGMVRRVAGNGAVCERSRRGETLALDEVCVDNSNWVPQSPVTLNPSVAMASAQMVPTFGSLRGEAGMEYFFREDVSIQASAGLAAYGTLLPQYVVNPPFVGLSARGGMSVVAYY